MLGKRVRDAVTGFEGIVTGRVEYLTGCAQLLVQPEVTADGTFVESRWFDETRLKVTSDKTLVLSRETRPLANGPDKPAPRK